jgi:hypothetical protein
MLDDRYQILGLFISNKKTTNPASKISHFTQIQVIETKKTAKKGSFFTP